MADWFEAGLLDLGHKVTFSEHSVEPAAINVFWECFDPWILRQIRLSGVTYGIVATEIPDGHAFNWRREMEWKDRYDGFLEAATGASFIWAMVESAVPFYSQFCKTAFMELGFSERLIPEYITEAPIFDFSFFGLRTPYRLQIVDAIRKFAKVEWPEQFLTPKQVGELIGKTKIGLNFKQSEQWPIPSPTRLGRFMMAKRDVACEFVPVATQQGEIVRMCPEQGDFTEFCFERLRSDWKGRAEQSFDEYRERMPMSRILEAIIDATCSEIRISSAKRESISIALPPPPMLLKSLGQWNIVAYDNRIFAILQEVGRVDVRLGFDVLRERFGEAAVLCADSIEELEFILIPAK